MGTGPVPGYSFGGGACRGTGCIVLFSGRRESRPAWRTPAAGPGPEHGPAAWVEVNNGMDNLLWPFNFLIYKDCVGNSYQIARQMVYILR